MDTLFFTAGPSHLYPGMRDMMTRALDAHIGSVSHRSVQFQRIFRLTTSSLRELWGIPETHEIFFFSSATEVWERLLQNCASGTSHHFVNGAFSEKFWQFAKQLQVPTSFTGADPGKAYDFSQPNVVGEPGLLNFTHNESATGVVLPMHDVYTFAAQYPDALVTLDTVSSAPYPVLNWHKLDAVYFSVQKAFGLPAGLGVGIFSPRVIERVKEKEAAGDILGTYHSFIELHKFAQKNQTPETPNVLSIWLLDQVIQAMLKRGLANIRKETDEKYELLKQFVAESSYLNFFVEDENIRSKTVIVLDTAGKTHELVEFLQDRKLEVSDGYGTYKNTHIRISNFPATSVEDMQKLINNLRAWEETQGEF